MKSTQHHKWLTTRNTHPSTLYPSPFTPHSQFTAFPYPISCCTYLLKATPFPHFSFATNQQYDTKKLKNNRSWNAHPQAPLGSSPCSQSGCECAATNPSSPPPPRALPAIQPQRTSPTARDTPLTSLPQCDANSTKTRPPSSNRSQDDHSPPVGTASTAPRPPTKDSPAGQYWILRNMTRRFLSVCRVIQ